MVWSHAKKERMELRRKCQWKVQKWSTVNKDFEVRPKIVFIQLEKTKGEMARKLISLPNFRKLKSGVLCRVWNRQLEDSYGNASFRDWKFSKWITSGHKMRLNQIRKGRDSKWLHRLFTMWVSPSGSRLTDAFVSQLPIHRASMQIRLIQLLTDFCPHLLQADYTAAWESSSGQSSHLLSQKLLPRM